MTIITKIPGVVFTDTTLPKLFRDSVITPGTKAAYDALDAYSWAKQSAPVAGDLWRDMSSAGGDATAPASGFGFAGGFTKNAPGFFTMPASAKVGANAAGFLFTLWLKYGTQATSGYTGIAGCFDSNSVGQYALTINNSANNGLFVASINSNSVVVIANGPTAGTIFQIGLGLKKQSDGSYLALTYKNGALINSISVGNAIQQPTTDPRIGTTSAGAYGDGFFGTFYRALFDDTSTLPDQNAITALVLKDYNTNVSRFS